MPRNGIAGSYGSSDVGQVSPKVELSPKGFLPLPKKEFKGKPKIEENSFILFILFFRDGVLLCLPGWSAVV